MEEIQFCIHFRLCQIYCCIEKKIVLLPIQERKNQLETFTGNGWLRNCDSTVCASSTVILKHISNDINIALYNYSFIFCIYSFFFGIFYDIWKSESSLLHECEGKVTSKFKYNKFPEFMH